MAAHLLLVWRWLTDQPPGRLLAIDAAKGIGIAFVLIGHALEVFFLNRPDGGFSLPAFYLWRTIYAFHMPLFFVLAGAARGWERTPPLRETATRAISLIVLALIWHLVGSLGILVQQLASGVPLSPALGLLILRPALVGAGLALPSLWFLIALAGVEIGFGIFKRAGIKGRLLVAGVFAASMLVPDDLGAVWQVQSWAPGAIFFAAGVYLRQIGWTWTQFVALPAKFITPALAALNMGCATLSATWCAAPGMGGRFAVVMAAGQFGYFPLFIFTGLFGALSVLGGAALTRKTPLPLLMAFVGRRSLAFYLVNGLVLTFLNPLLKLKVPVFDNFATIVASVLLIGFVSGLAALLLEPLVVLSTTLAKRAAIAITARPGERSRVGAGFAPAQNMSQQ